MGTSWVNNWDGVYITLCLSSRRGTQPFNTAASITPHQENDVLLDPINKKIILRNCLVCESVFLHERGTLLKAGSIVINNVAPYIQGAAPEFRNLSELSFNQHWKD